MDPAHYMDVALLRDYAARQAADANAIVNLCDALQAKEKELQTMRAAVAKAAPSMPAAPKAAPAQ